MAKWIPAWRYVPINCNHDMGVLENITRTGAFTNKKGDSHGKTI
jgi:hypothetical protein